MLTFMNQPRRFRKKRAQSYASIDTRRGISMRCSIFRKRSFHSSNKAVDRERKQRATFVAAFGS